MLEIPPFSDLRNRMKEKHSLTPFWEISIFLYNVTTVRKPTHSGQIQVFFAFML